MRAVATHLVGKLSQQYDAFHILSSLMRSGDVDWDERFFDSPIRYEAGEALLKFATPATWEVFVDSYFIDPRDDLLSFQGEWIAYLTDILSGEAKEYTDIQLWGDESHRAWFRALKDISAEQLAAMVD